MKSYRVKYTVNNGGRSTVLQLHGGTESEAIEKIKKYGGVPKDATIVILSIELK